MEETLGKRIVANRKHLGLTQDKLAELLGVTAQAVSKWENDQSCPDIAMLPKLAEVFECTTDALLGLAPREIHTAGIVETETVAEDKPDGLHVMDGTWELKWDGGRRSSLGIALWLLITGGLSMASAVGHWGVDTRHILWSSGLMVFGLFGLFRKFSVLNLGTFLFGGYYLLWHMQVLPPSLTILRWEVVIPGTFLLFGFCLLADSFRKPKHGSFQVSHNGTPLGKHSSHCIYDGETFDCSTSFGENHHLITLPRLSGGSASLSFGELEIDLSGCEEINDVCTLDLSCSFGELELLVPGRFRVEPDISTAFASLQTKGAPSSEAGARIYVNGSANFGEIIIRYI